MKYRPDIDGLRALAVLPVVFFHAGFRIFSGGFVGVDIFFVISGFLITSIIVDDLDKGRFSIRNFYERRIRRILPALYTVCSISMVAAVLFFLPEDLIAFGKSLGATVFFVSNILFWSEAGYFDASADLKPLLHTWSLAVEEQFYVFFPIALFALYRFFKKPSVSVILLTVALASLVLSIWAADHKPSAAFYWAPTRAWELLLGALLAINFFPALKSKGQQEGAGLIGLGLILYAVLFFDDATSFPGINALFPCMGAGLIIYANESRLTLSGKFLSIKPLVFIGLCSYSFYLWHWPLFVFANYISLNAISSLMAAGLIATAFALAVFTWRYIERPFRDKSFLTGKWKVFILAFAASLPLIAAMFILTLSKGLPQRFPDIHLLEEAKKDVVDPACVDIATSDYETKKCLFGDNQARSPSFIVWGDSHAGALVRGISQAAERQGRSGYLASLSGCSPLLDVTLARDEDQEKCPLFNQQILADIKKGDVVFLVARWTYYTHRSLVNHEGPTWLRDEQSRKISISENYRVMEQALNKTIRAIQQKGAKPVLVDTVPEYARSVPETLYRFKKDVIISKPIFLKNRTDTTALLTEAATINKIDYIDPSVVFCDEDQCYGNDEAGSYYSDNDHVTLKGASKLSGLFDRLLP